MINTLAISNNDFTVETRFKLNSMYEILKNYSTCSIFFNLLMSSQLPFLIISVPKQYIPSNSKNILCILWKLLNYGEPSLNTTLHLPRRKRHYCAIRSRCAFSSFQILSVLRMNSRFFRLARSASNWFATRAKYRCAPPIGQPVCFLCFPAFQYRHRYRSIVPIRRRTRKIGPCVKRGIFRGRKISDSTIFIPVSCPIDPRHCWSSFKFVKFSLT